MFSTSQEVEIHVLEIDAPTSLFPCLKQTMRPKPMEVSLKHTRRHRSEAEVQNITGIRSVCCLPATSRIRHPVGPDADQPARSDSKDYRTVITVQPFVPKLTLKKKRISCRSKGCGGDKFAESSARREARSPCDCVRDPPSRTWHQVNPEGMKKPSSVAPDLSVTVTEQRPSVSPVCNKVDDASHVDREKRNRLASR